MEMETAGRIFTGGGNDFYDAGSSGICGGSGCIRRPYGVVQSITRNIQRTADIRKEPKGQPVNMSILRIATPL